VTPGLYPNEKRWAVPFVASALALFVLGAGLAYYTLPRALEFLVDIGGDDLVTAFAPGKYFRLITYMMLAFGIGFEFPIVLIFLQMAGILETDTLRRGRRFAIVGICILVAVITPSGDPISMLMLSVPMVIFYEIAIVIGSVITKRRALRDAA
jgi:sec-independent protein translocase protein TatC